MCTPLLHAARRGHAKAVVLLVKSEANIETKDEDGRSALSYAADSSHTKIVRELLANGAAVDAADKQGRTPLSYAVGMYNKVQVVTELVKNGADVNLKDKAGMTVMSHALSIYDNDKIVAELIKNGAVVDVPDKTGKTTLSHAAKKGYPDTIKELVTRGAFIDVKDTRGRTPLLLAAKKEKKEAALELINLGADVHIKDSLGRTALSYAAEAGLDKVVLALIESGAILDAADNSGRSALSYAGQNGHRAVVTELFQRGVFDLSSDPSSDIALFAAAAMGDLNPLQELVSKGESIDAATKDGRTLLCYAAELGKMDVVQFLVENGASVRVKLNSTDCGREWESPLTLAGRAGHMQISQALIEAGAPVNVRSGSDGETPLISAARWGFFSGGVQTLCAHGGSFRFEDVPDDECPLILGTLETMGKLSVEAFEFDHVCGRVVERLNDICSQLQLRDASQVQKDTLVSLASVTLRFCSLLLQVEKKPLSRFIGIRGLLCRLNDFHEELDHFVRMLGVVNNASDWRAQLEDDRWQLRSRIEDVLSTEATLIDQHKFTSVKHEAVMLLQYELKPRDEEVDSRVQESIARVLDRLIRECKVKAEAVPEWFISRDEVEFQLWNVTRSERELKYYDGTWRKTSVTIEHSWRFEPDDLFRSASQWFPLSHPNVAKLFGVRHLGFPKFFVYESVPDAQQLHEFLRDEANRQHTWKCLYGAALGLQHLHS
ncbi:Tkl protein kinase [Globisporangium polare]